MRTIIVLLFAVFIGAGFLLADNMHIRQDFTVIKQQNAQLTQENNNLIIERDTVIANLNESNQKNAELAQKNQMQDEQIRQLISENTNLKDQNISLQRKAERISFFNSFQSTLPKALSFVILLPIVPASMAATYIFVRYNKNHTQHKDTKKRQNTLVQLTDDEVKEIIRIRREK